MIPYFLLVFISFLMYFVCVEKRKNRQTVLVGYGEQNEAKNLSLDVFFFILLLLLACRAETVGVDIGNYKYIFEKSAYQSLSKIFSYWEECLFAFLTYILYHISSDYRIYLMVIAVIEIVPLSYVYCQDKRHSLAKIALFSNMSTFVMLFSGIRQAIAISLGVLAFECIKRKRTVLLIIITLVAFLIHTSGFMIAFLYPLYYVRFKKKHLFAVVPVIALFYVFNRQIFLFASEVLSRISYRFDAQISETGAFSSLILFAALAVFAYIISDEQQMDSEAFALRNILVFAVLIQCFAPLHTLAMRMNYYFIIFIPLAVGKCLTTPRKKYRDIAKWGEIVLVVFFMLYFFYSVYTAYVTGRGMLGIVPYVPFWAEQGIIL